ncbi:tRNA (adenosine(37)-N6)-dimethylallyltransferase MiaA [Weissella kandleri]|uniref:tRNA (adenosine(37)-N6)-dimethylallyltransferase MiaA n=1 Tax=Weissella kandleri TaxID=1616 RepID=UPI00387E40E4
MQKIIVIVGPTAVGKTALSLDLAARYHGEIISGDSMQIYRGLDIGTAKATPAEQAKAPHHMLDIVDLDVNYSVAEFVQQARQVIQKIANRGKIPIVVGGTGFYIQALLGDRTLVDESQPLDAAAEQAWRQRVALEGEAPLRAALRQVDPVSAERIVPGQIRRLIRALLMTQAVGKPFSEQELPAHRIYDALIIGLNTERPVLYERINQRVTSMLQTGLLAEAQLVQQLPAAATAKQAIGYKELFPYLRGEEALLTGEQRLQQASRRYAKRQITWFKHQLKGIQWYDLVLNSNDQQRLNRDVTEFIQA